MIARDEQNVYARSTTGHGHIADVRIRWREGRPTVELKIVLDFVDDLDQLHRQTASHVDIAINTTSELRPLFDAP